MNLAEPHSPNDYRSMEFLCARILERNRDSIRIRKPHIAVANLVRIIEATLKLSNRQGFHATTLRQLATACGLSMGGLYAYIDNKTTLLSMILGEVSSSAMEVLSSAPQSVRADPARHLVWLVDSHIRLTEAMQPWFVFAYMEAKSFPPAARHAAVDSEAATEQIFATVLKEGVVSRQFAAIDPELTASLIKPLLQDWYIKRAKYRKRGTTMDDYIAAVTAFIEAAVHARDSSG